MPNFNRATLSLEPINEAVNAAIERAAATAAEMPRPYLGASIIGHECARRIQYDWWCKPVRAKSSTAGTISSSARASVSSLPVSSLRRLKRSPSPPSMVRSAATLTASSFMVRTCPAPM